MNDQFFIDPRFSLAMQLVAYGSLVASIATLSSRSRTPLFFGGLFLATADPRFGLELGGLNPSILGLYVWAAVWMTYLFTANHRRGLDAGPFVTVNRLGSVFFVSLLLLAMSLAGDFGIAAKSFVLIFLPYFALLPFGVAMANEGNGTLEVRLSFLRGVQLGYAFYVVLTRIFAAGEVTGALGDISVSATIVAIMCSYGILITIHLLRWDKAPELRIVNLVALLLFAISAVQTLSRGPLAAILIALPIQLLTMYGDRIRRSPGAAFGSALALVGAVALVATNADYVLEKRNVQADSDVLSSVSEQFLSSRYKYILEVVDFDSIPVSSLMTGHGLGASEDIARSLGVYRIESFWLEAAYDIGIAGAIALFIALARNAWAMARREPPDAGGFGVLYASLFLFTLFLTPSSFGWFLQGNTGFVYVSILMLACRRVSRAMPATVPLDAHHDWPAPTGGSV